jgi:hypothetical protein
MGRERTQQGELGTIVSNRPSAAISLIDGSMMSNLFQFHAANLLMVVGVIPFAATLYRVGMSWNYRGDAALSAVFIISYMYAFAYVAALAIGFPASIWSYRLSKTSGLDSPLGVKAASLRRNYHAHSVRFICGDRIRVALR